MSTFAGLSNHARERRFMIWAAVGFSGIRRSYHATMEVRMKLGMNMLLWSTDVCGSEFDPVFAMLKDAGFDGVEIPIFDREVEKYAGLRTRLDGLGPQALAVSARAAHDNPITPDAAVPAEA